MKLNGNVINPGEMRTRIVLARREMTTDAGGFNKPTHPYISRVWARWKNVHGSEAWTAAEALGAEAAATVLIRYRPDIDETCLVVKDAFVSETVPEHEGDPVSLTYTGGQIYEIVSMDDIGERHEYIELKVKRKKAG